jgi:hypothetical protein
MCQIGLLRDMRRSRQLLILCKGRVFRRSFTYRLDIKCLSPEVRRIYLTNVDSLPFHLDFAASAKVLSVLFPSAFGVGENLAPYRAPISWASITIHITIPPAAA